MGVDIGLPSIPASSSRQMSMYLAVMATAVLET
jgi:hypothetical protein